ncbi:MAG: hypothetical protein JO210_20060 [Acidobacteriaceae bacterium]|nr:hypothetical protein [Acidobacteriaceae bacterium]
MSVLDDGTTQITARSGQGEIFGPRGSQVLPSGQTVLVRGNAGDPEFRNAPEIARDQFDDWSAHRDSDLLGSQSYQFVSTDVAGAADLDNYGKWVPSQYGQVWSPQSEPAGWSPYSTGQWSWDDYYGWNWVDSAPWGWAPYHYGRWFWNGGYGWSWWPGGIGAAFWSPALVGFFGWGGFGFGIGIGGLGWCALAPFESFVRWWGPGWYGRGWAGRGFRPYNNFARNVDISRTYRNAAYRGGAMTASYNAFGGPHQRFAPATRTQLANASSFRGGQLPVTPTRASYQFSNRAAVANPRLVSASNQRFFQSSQFRNQQQFRTTSPNLNQQQFRPASPNLNSSRSAHGVAPNMQNSYTGRSNYSGSSGSSSGWQRFGDPGNAGALRQGFTGGSEQSGWHHFGQPQPQGNGSSSWGGGRLNTAPTPNRNSGPTANPRSYSPSFTPRNTPNNNAPTYIRPSYNAPNYSAPRYDAPSYNAPRDSVPRASHYSAPAGGGHSGGSSGGGHSGGSSGGGGHGGGSGGGHHR